MKLSRRNIKAVFSPSPPPIPSRFYPDSPPQNPPPTVRIFKEEGCRGADATVKEGEEEGWGGREEKKREGSENEDRHSSSPLQCDSGGRRAGGGWWVEEGGKWWGVPGRHKNMREKAKHLSYFFYKDAAWDSPCTSHKINVMFLHSFL